MLEPRFLDLWTGFRKKGNRPIGLTGVQLVLEPRFLALGTGFKESCNQRFRTFTMNIEFKVSSYRPHWL